MWGVTLNIYGIYILSVYSPFSDWLVDYANPFKCLFMPTKYNTITYFPKRPALSSLSACKNSCRA